MNFQKHFEEEINLLCKTNLAEFSYVKDYLLTPGKQFRPQLYLDYIVSQRELHKTDLAIASAIEILHLFFLVHDDIMDGDSLRREMPTIHAYYAKDYGELKGNGIGIVVGDLLFSSATGLFTENLKTPEALKLVFEVINITAKGQLEEYLLIPGSNSTTFDILNYYESKTALYSVYLPLALGYFQCNQQIDFKYLELLKNFSKYLGIAFQVNDDLIEFKLEKKRNSDLVCSDIMRGKVTPILNCILENIDKQLLSECLQQWKNGGLSLELHDQLLSIGNKFGAIEYAEKIISTNLTKALNIAEELKLNDLPTIQLLGKILSNKNVQKIDIYAKA